MQEMTMTPKSFWERPEGKAGKAVLWAVPALAIIAILMFLPALIAFFSNLLYLGFLVGIIAVLFVLANDKNFKNFCSVMFMLAMKWLVDKAITIDPAAVVRQKLKQLEERMELMYEQMKQLRGTIKQLEMKRGENTKNMENCLKLAEQAKARGADDVVYINTRQAARLEEANKAYDIELVRIRGLDGVIAQFHKAAKITLEDNKNAFELKEKQYLAIKQAHSAYSSAMTVLNGSVDDRALAEQALELMDNEIGMKLGEIERFLEDSTTYLNGIDIQNDVFAKNGDELLQRWMKEGSSILQAKPAAIENKPIQPLVGNTVVGSKYLNLAQTVTVNK